MMNREEILKIFTNEQLKVLRDNFFIIEERDYLPEEYSQEIVEVLRDLKSGDYFKELEIEKYEDFENSIYSDFDGGYATMDIQLSDFIVTVTVYKNMLGDSAMLEDLINIEVLDCEYLYNKNIEHINIDTKEYKQMLETGKIYL